MNSGFLGDASHSCQHILQVVALLLFAMLSPDHLRPVLQGTSSLERARERERDQPATHSDHAQTNGFRSASHAVDVVEENLSFLAFLYDRHVRRTIESSDFCDMILCIAGGAF